MIVIGLLPLIAWKGFTLFYYGFPLPNTAYAKILNTGVSRTELVQQGFRYFEDLIISQPLTFFIILVGMSIPFLIKENFQLPPNFFVFNIKKI